MAAKYPIVKFMTRDQSVVHKNNKRAASALRQEDSKCSLDPIQSCYKSGVLYRSDYGVYAPYQRASDPTSRSPLNLNGNLMPQKMALARETR